MIKMAEYAKRRKQLLKKIGPTGIIVLPSAKEVLRNGDYNFYYRQNSDFYYLTGFDEPDAVAVLLPKNKQGEYLLFNRPRNREKEIWEGVRAGQEGARTLYGADEAFPIGDFEKKLPELLAGRTEIHYTLGLNKEFDELMLDALNKVRSKIRQGQQFPTAFIDSSNTLHEMRLIKSPAEIAVIRKATQISIDGHMRAIRACKPGMNECELEAELLYEFNRQGARAVAYTSIVGGGANTCTLHYCTNNQIIQEGDLVLIDAGCEYQNYASDITRTFPASGRFSAEQRAIYEIVLSAQIAGIKAVRPGVPWPTVQNIVVNILTQGLIELGLLKGNLRDLIEQEAYFKFYMHKSGHWLGLDVHDVGRYKVDGKWRNFEAGMVFTVEPGIYISSEIPGIPKKWHNIGVRIEDDILVTTTGNENLTSRLPKKIEDIEALMK